MLYFQICIIGVALLIVPLISSHNDNTQEWKMLRTVMVLTIFDMISEMVFRVHVGKMLPHMHQILIFSIYASLLFQALMGLTWLLYAIQLLKVTVRSRICKILVFVPFGINMLNLVLNPFLHLHFQVTRSNEYLPGPFAYFDMLVTFTYFFAASVIALIERKYAKNAYEKRNCVVILLFVVLPITGIVLQSFFYGAYLLQAFFAIGLVSTYINIQDSHISTDYLTKVNNRASLISYYENMVNQKKAEEAYALMILDIDKFKAINDTLGHASGDKALIIAADLLKEACSNQDAFLARVGGDEFCMLLRNATSEKTELMIQKINQLFQQANQEKKLLLPVTVSIGYAICKEKRSFDILFKEADQMMYQVKRKKY